MKQTVQYTLVGAAVVFCALSSAHAAKPTPLGSWRDWDAFSLGSGGQKVCYMASLPKKSRPRGVRHGTVYVTVSHKPARRVRDEVNIVTGYSFRTGSEVTTTIGGTRLNLFTSAQEAWAYDPKDDARLVAAMKRGAQMAVAGTSARGTKTSYEFSLYGFSSAYEAISKACNLR